MQTHQPELKKTTAAWRKALWLPVWLLGAALVLLLLTAGAVFLLQDKIKQRAIAELNTQLTVPVQVSGPIELSVWKHFPFAALSFNDVSIDDKLRKKKKLLRVKEISFLCNIYSLFTPSVEFNRIVIKNGELNIYVTENGQANYNILKPQKESTGELSAQLKRAQLRNIRFNLNDRQNNTQIQAQVNNVTLSGNFSAQEYDLKTMLDIEAQQLLVSNETYLSNRTLAGTFTLHVNTMQKKYVLKNAEVSLDGSMFKAEGSASQLKKGTALDFTLLNEGEDVQQLLALLPAAVKTSMAGADGSGRYAITASVKGVLSGGSVPAIKVEASLQNSELKLGRYNKLLQEVNATATYTADAKGNDQLIISNFNCKLNDLPFRFSLQLKNLANPSFDFSADGVLHLTEIATLIPDSVLQEPGGQIEFRKFHLSGRKEDFTSPEQSTLTGSGEFLLKEVEFQQNGITYGNINGLLRYEKSLIEAKNFTLHFLSTDFAFTGSIENLFAFAYNLSSKRKANEVVLGVNGHLKAETFNLSGILEAYDKKNRPGAQQKEKINIREVLQMKGNLDIELRRFIFRKMLLEHVEGNLQVSPGALRINDLTALAMKGDVKTNGLITFTAADDLVMQLDIRASQLDIPTVFTQCENFGQTTLTDRHVKGTLQLAVMLNSTWKNYKDLDPASLNAIVDFNLKNGELIGFEPLRAASKFIRVEELERIRFAELSNTVQIANQRFDIPEFEIKTSALNLIVYGYHYFRNDIDYHFKINLHKLLAQKFNRNLRGDISYMEQDPYEGLNLYLTMTGNLSNPVIKYDKGSAKKKVLDDFRKEKDVLKSLLKNAPIQTNPEEKKREEKYFDVNEEPQFMDLPE